MGGPNFVEIFTCWTKWGLWAVKNLAVEFPDIVAFGADHFLETAVQLDCNRPGAFGVKGNLSGQRL
jgi:hypothetical protein